MEEYKIENFKKLYHGADFPRFRKLVPSECEMLRVKAAERLGLSPQASGLEVVRLLSAASGTVLGYVSEVGAPNLTELFLHVGQHGSGEVFVNWHRFDVVDSFDQEDLCSNFDDIWYPGVDDIEIFDGTCTWFLIVSHDGRMKLVQL